MWLAGADNGTSSCMCVRWANLKLYQFRFDDFPVRWQWSLKLAPRFYRSFGAMMLAPCKGKFNLLWLTGRSCSLKSRAKVWSNSAVGSLMACSGNRRTKMCCSLEQTREPGSGGTGQKREELSDKIVIRNLSSKE